ncbi:thiamine pyrophosphate-dependent dehydrogenase E1 component subunit alpha [Ancylobacter dichloromethanicus]|uniref:Acetoin:2,6-dichlorophenolindophenol oxidoreductase subunit alpha n=1 Tax=Ancylobacter dichloromethanicus TaxID=518825 RepID=A0A9W6J9S8_9HYPH|nr:thiamine pyrophosphate-dependent dehydrogenase E1 component subunit alpha [Ancylobacter dichloromethanicus]MBS7553247.1 thiamine pyrophosphate-dependent dehydrogenase E1 component subunit alpha [Ancylobacter dichloromethanicus]GLK73027.1 acetoin:2,6-dichlorophenolindophenol oxidoreductase subunit alpha [Ancylobacter dichloromethanicus]
MKNSPSTDEQLEMHRKMAVVRRLEERLGELHKAGKTRGPIHRCDGQEAVGVGATAVLGAGDFVTSTHRGHAHYIGKGVDIRGVAAEILGRATGTCGGRAGHMLIGDRDKGMIGGNAIVGGSIPAATGMALSIQVRRTADVAMCFFGDGAAQTGICHESMNIAGLWKLPVIFILEHNQFGLTVHHSVQSPVADLSIRAAGYAMPAEIVDGNDTVAMYRAAARAVERARRGEGPSLIEAKTYRMQGFSTSDMGGYQSAADLAEWSRRDPLAVSRRALLDAVGAERLDAVEAGAAGEVDAAVEEALAAPLPSFELFTRSSPYATAPEAV